MNQEKEEKEKDVVCSVCLKEIKEKDVFITNCGHIFHGSCMLNWCKVLRNSNKSEQCPLCRGNLIPGNILVNIDYHEIVKKILHDFVQVFNSHNVSFESVSSLNETVMWMTIPFTCQEALTEIIERHCFGNS